ncbi:hypothetical protein CFOL_v3_33530 [Cephalotus follicularis]|uniref:Uncharacterized protein n=1 Tax=Cephalotus follicularis TaxID=3775 RepID=A0A1Q3DCD0_CEPFO|nr:hypothetical protein CFOL_v3_33530 [Cephalotus follicularis]
MRKCWRRRKYRRIGKATTSRKNVKMIRFQRNQHRRVWKIRRVAKIHCKIVLPLKLFWAKFKNAYIDMMLNLAGNVGSLNTANSFGGKRIPRSRQVQIKYSNDEIEDRFVYEIYMALVATRELSARQRI